MRYSSRYKISQEQPSPYAMTVIFQDLDRAFKMNNINVFPHEPYEIHPFDRSGKFTWGRFYQFYVSGKPKRIIYNNMSFIQSRFNAITNGQPYSNKAQIESLFAANKATSFSSISRKCLYNIIFQLLDTFNEIFKSL